MSVPTCDRSVRRVCCWAPCGRKISIEGLNSLELYALSKRLTSDTSMSSLIVFSWNYLRLATWILSETVNNFFDFELPSVAVANTHTHTHTHTRLTALCPGLPGWVGTRKVKPIWILLKQETVSGSGIHWAVCKSAPRSSQITMPSPHRSVFYRPDALPAAQPTASKHSC